MNNVNRNFVEEKYLISCACTDAELRIYNYNTHSHELNLTQTVKIDENEEVISLSVDWDKQDKSHLLTSHSDGYISIHNINGEEISKVWILYIFDNYSGKVIIYMECQLKCGLLIIIK